MYCRGPTMYMASFYILVLFHHHFSVENVCEYCCRKKPREANLKRISWFSLFSLARAYDVMATAYGLMRLGRRFSRQAAALSILPERLWTEGDEKEGEGESGQNRSIVTGSEITASIVMLSAVATGRDTGYTGRPGYQRTNTQRTLANDSYS